MRLHEVCFRYQRSGPWVLRGVTVAVERGQVIVVQGRNGAGKSTLLQLAAGVLTPRKGTIQDRPARVGWVPERFPTELPFTVGGYLSAMAAVAGGRSRPEPAIERLGLSGFRNTRLAALSKGTAQRVGLAQALLAPPELLVLDEPWEGLDAATRDLVPEVVAELVGAGASVLVSDHRGETARLPGAICWTVADGQVADAGAAETPWLIEVEAVDGPAAVAALRAAGHHILRVRS
jgi:ABC-type Mn2+/Zn2+ transport system ATPase subunit